MMNDGHAMSALYLTIFITRIFYSLQSYKSPNCHVKMSVIKTYPPTNIDMTFGMTVWVGMYVSPYG